MRTLPAAVRRAALIAAVSGGAAALDRKGELIKLALRVGFRLQLQIAVALRVLRARTVSEKQHPGGASCSSLGSRAPSIELQALNDLLMLVTKPPPPFHRFSLWLWRFMMWSSSWNPVSTPLTPALAGELPSSSPSWPPSSPTSSSPTAPLATPRGRWFRWPGAGCGARSPVVLFLHGGGFTAGAPSSYSGFCCELSRLADARVFAVAYRLAPEHRAPAGLDDVHAAYAWLLWHVAESEGQGGGAGGGGGQSGGSAGDADSGDGSVREADVRRRLLCAARRVVVVGDSAGGGLVLLLLHRLRARALSLQAAAGLPCPLPQPAAAVAISPWLDLTGSGQSYFSNRGSEQLFRQRGAISGNADLVVPLGDPLGKRNPECSALFAPAAHWQGLPPLWLLASERELLRDDTIRAYASLRRADPHCQARLTVVPHVMHVFPIFLEAAPECREWAARIGDYVAEQVATATVTCTSAGGGGEDVSEDSTSDSDRSLSPSITAATATVTLVHCSKL